MLIVAIATMSCAPEVPESTDFGDGALEPAIATKSLTLSEITSETATITFEKATKEGVDDATISYQAYYSTEANIYDLDTTITNGTAYSNPVEDITQIMVTGLTVNTSYYFNILARNSAGNGAAYSMAVTSTTDGGSEVPTYTATALDFTDSDLNSDEIEGTLTITMADDETDITHYVVYWGVGDDTLLEGETAISEIQVTGADLTYDFAADTAVPDTATYFVVRTKNDKGEMDTGVSLAFTDAVTPGIASSVAFTDQDTDESQIAGIVYIGMATDETDITHYVLYWGSAADTKLTGQNALATIPKTGADLGHSIAANTAIQAGATHLLVFTKNATSELATPKAVALVDIAIPTNTAAGITFTDTDKHKGELGGTISITKATNEADITHYVVYWGSNATTKLSGETAIATIATTGLGASVVIPANTAVPSGANRLLVYTKNANGEMATGIGMVITDMAVPVNAAQLVCFMDTKKPGQTDGKINGTVTFTRAADESDITTYSLYWSNDGVTALAGQTILATFAQTTGGNTIHSFSFDHRLSSYGNPTHFVIFTSNADGMMDTGVATVGTRLDDMATTPNPCP
ncbi:MAG: fibronectin type III domain-containing protein [SAR324 cluster bacterium]|nr:fibronectin type III domain-containing protein [SAR324 cluster bacterium]